MLTPSPCWNPETGECEKHKLGCKKTCKAWQDWEIIHAKERYQLQSDLYRGKEADLFLVDHERRRRDRQKYIRDYEKTRRRK